MTHQPIQDTISFQLRADTVVVSDTVRVTVYVNALVTTDTTETTLRRDIKEALSNFIEADWSFNGLERSADESGFERVVIRATARVKETENYNLENRALLVSRQGLKLANITVDTGVPATLLEAAEKKLRSEIVNKATEELKELVEATKREYRISSIRFANQGDPYQRKVGSVSNQTYVNNMAFASAVGGSPGVSDDDSISNAQKVSLAADVVFSVSVV
jgi:hypothetical protein